MTSQLGINFNIRLIGEDAAARFRQISASMAGVHSATKNVRESLAGVASGFQSLAVAGAAVAGVGAGLLSWAKAATDAADDVGDLAARYGVASEAIQVYGDLVKDAGGSTEDAAAAFKFLNKSMHGAIYGNEQLQAAFAGVGLSVAELKGLKPEQVLERVADAFQGSNKELEKQAVLTALMGRNGTVMMGVMNGGSAAIREHYRQMNDDGRIFTQQQLESADAFAKQWQRTAGVLEGMKNMLGLELMGALSPIIEQFRAWTTANKGLIATRVREFFVHLPPLLDSIAEVATAVGSAFSAIAGPIKTVSHLFGMTAVVWGGVALAAAPLAMSLGSLAFGVFGLLKAAFLLLAPLGLVGVAFAGLAIAGVALYARWDEVVGGAKALWSDLGDAIGVVAARISGHWEAMKDGAVAAWSDWSNFVGDVIFEVIKKWEKLQSIFGGVSSIFSGINPFSSAMGSGASMGNALQGSGTGSGNGSGGVPAMLASQQQVGGLIRIQVDSEGKARVRGVEKQGNVDLMADTGVMGMAM